ncbi:DinB family protein [Paenibacillus aestuarii]|uniref:DinB family protein n=1 Tax=Paenibacillus aestuarii TaxID=516965 RepID=A0ABW0KEZ6_9BACL|nr:DinB family protein [Paenibacillus aestuarii]
MTQSILRTGIMLRQMVIGQLQAMTETQMDIQPAGFNNTIRWNIGHMIYWFDKCSAVSFGIPSAIPAHYEALFSSGTKPSDWTIAPPAKDELLQTLAAQLSQLSELSPEKLDTILTSPYQLGPFEFHTAGELLNFALLHEAIHLGIISSQIKFI